MTIKSFLRTMSSGCKLKYVERKKIVKLQRSLLNDNNRRQMVVSPKVANCVMRGRLFMAKFIGATSHFSINVSARYFSSFFTKSWKIFFSTYRSIKYSHLCSICLKMTFMGVENCKTKIIFRMRIRRIIR